MPPLVLERFEDKTTIFDTRGVDFLLKPSVVALIRILFGINEVSMMRANQDASGIISRYTAKVHSPTPGIHFLHPRGLAPMLYGCWCVSRFC